MGSRRRSADGADLAYSTGQAARYCFVTSDTILNWIHAGDLPAQRTAGGQFRIRQVDLLAFMRLHQMRTDLLREESDVRPMCWEHHCPGNLDPHCARCVVYKSKALDCFQIREAVPVGIYLMPDCQTCDYYQHHCQPSRDEE